jgi:hypothetical protein
MENAESAVLIKKHVILAKTVNMLNSTAIFNIEFRIKP